MIKTLNVPGQFISKFLNEYQEFENQKIAQLEEEILNLRNQIYENELELKSLENSRPYNNLDISLKEVRNLYQFIRSDKFYMLQ